MRVAISAFIGSALLFGAAGAGAADYASWQGHWIWNKTESHYPPGFPEIQSHTMDVTRDDGNLLQYTDSFTIGANGPTTVTFDGAYDGKMHKMSDGQLMAFRHVGKDGYQDHWTSAQGTVGSDRCTFSNDARKLTCHGQFTPPKGQTVRFVEVFDKAP